MRPNWFLAFPVCPFPWLTELGRHLPAGCRPFHPADYHVTFVFLGAPEGDVPAALAPHLAEFEAEAPPAFRIRPHRGLALPQPARCSALALGFDDDAECRRLQAAMTHWRDRFCDAVGARRETRPPLPHLTYARPARACSVEARALAAQTALAQVLPDQVISLEKLALYSWSDIPSDQKFKTVKTIELFKA